MAEFMAENPNIFEVLETYFKGQSKQKAESSKRKSDGSPEIPFDEKSDMRHSIRSTLKRVSSKVTFKIASLTKAFSRGLLGKRAEKEPRHPGRLEVDYMRTPPFTDDINEERLPPNFKLLTISSYDGSSPCFYLSLSAILYT
mgnify:CR=1 FL=1